METALLYLAKGFYYLCLLIGGSILVGTMLTIIIFVVLVVIAYKDTKANK